MHIHFLRSSVVAGVVGVLGFFALSAVSLRHDHDAAEERAYVEVRNISRLMEQHTAATIRNIDLVLQDIQGHVRERDLADHAQAGPTHELNVLLAAKKQVLPEVHGLHVVDARGDFIYSSVQPMHRVNMADRWHFTVQRDRADQGLAVSEPVVGRTTGQWTMAFTRRLNHPDGSFAGVVVATFLPTSFEPYYQTLKLGTHGSVAIRDEKARLLARFPPRPDQVGVFDPRHPALPYLQRGDREAFYYAHSVVDGAYRVHSLRRVGNYPLYVFAGLAPDDYMADWRRNLVYHAAGGGVLALVVAGLVFFARREEKQRARAEAALEQSEAQSRLVLEQSPIGVFHFGIDLRLTYSNERFAHILHTTVDRLQGLDLTLLRDPVVIPALWAALEGKLGSYEGPYRVTLSDVVIWISFRTGPLRGESGHIVGGVGIVEDVTERYRAAQELRQSEERFRTMADFTYDWEYWQGADGSIIYMTPSCERITGYRVEEFMANPHLLGDIVVAEDRPGFDDHVEHAVFHEGSVVDFRIRRRDGEECWIAHGCRPVRSETGEYLGRRVSNRDISDRKFLEAALTRVNDHLEQRVREEVERNREKDQMLIQQSRLAAMGEMVHNIAHQWRQPLNALAVVVANIKDDFDYGELTEANLQEAVEHCRRLLGKMSMTIDDFRNFFRPDREEVIFDPAKEVDEALFILEASLSSKGIRVDSQLSRGLRVSGFPNQFAQALLNLLVNAKEVLQERRSEGRSIVLRLARADESVVLSVADNGGGIAADVLPKIFDPYFTTKEQGSGIGLYMTKMIVERNMRGSINAENCGEGARFTIVLPLYQGDNNEPDA